MCVELAILDSCWLTKSAASCTGELSASLSLPPSLFARFQNHPTPSRLPEWVSSSRPRALLVIHLSVPLSLCLSLPPLVLSAGFPLSLSSRKQHNKHTLSLPSGYRAFRDRSIMARITEYTPEDGSQRGPETEETQETPEIQNTQETLEPPATTTTTEQRVSSVSSKSTHSSPEIDGRRDSGCDADTNSDDIASPTPPANDTPVASTGRSSPVSSKEESPFVERSNPMGSGNAQTVSSKDPKAVAQAATDMKNVVRRKLTGYVGFANLPNQWHRKSVRKGFNFNVMVVGKSTLPPFFTKNGSGVDMGHQVNLVSESPLSSTRCSTLLSTPRRSALPPATTLSPRPCPSIRSVPTLRRTVFACV